jgi:hypothetical protein
MQFSTRRKKREYAKRKLLRETDDHCILLYSSLSINSFLTMYMVLDSGNLEALGKLQDRDASSLRYTGSMYGAGSCL